MRKDLDAHYQIIQPAHAALEAGFRFPRPDNNVTANIVLIGVENLEELLVINERLERKGIDHYMFEEPDHGAGYTSIATRPVYSSKERKVFGLYRTWSA